MDLGSILLALSLILLVAAFVARPVQAGRRQAHSRSTSIRDGLAAQREAILVELRDLDFDHTTGKLDEADYAAQRGRLLARGADVLRALDQVPVDVRHPDSLDDEIERLVAARRAARPQAADSRPAAGATTSGYCSQCGRALQPGDKFCAGCGAKVALAEAGP